MVMEYLDGDDLAQTLESGGPLPWQQAVDYVLQALRGRRRGALARHRAPRSQAGEPVPRAAARRRAAREGARLRHLEDRSTRGERHVRSRRRRRCSARRVHVAGAAPQREERRRADGHLGARRHPLSSSSRARSRSRRSRSASSSRPCSSRSPPRFASRAPTFRRSSKRPIAAVCRATSMIDSRTSPSSRRRSKGSRARTRRCRSRAFERR